MKTIEEETPGMNGGILPEKENVTTHETTQFHDQSGIVSADYNMPEEERTVVDPYFKESLIDFLERPYMVSTTQWKLESPQNTCILRLAFPDELFKVPAIWDKLTNFAYLRAALKISVRVNGTPFHYGKLMAVWRPVSFGTTANPSGQPTGYDNIWSLSAYPKVLISPNTNAVTDLEVPFIMPVEWMETAAFRETWRSYTNRRVVNTMGIFELWVLNPLYSNQAQVPSVYVSIYANFKDVELAGYTAEDFEFQSDPMPIPVSNLAFEWLPKVQGSLIRKVAKGAISILDFLGLSNTLEEDQNAFSAKQTNIGHSTTRTYGTSLKLSMNNDEEERVVFGDVRDQMSMKAVATSENFITTFKISNESLASSNLFQLPVTPMLRGRKTGSYEFSFRPRFGYLAPFFTLWRGGMKFRFQFVCSAFHSLRVQIAWVPNDNSVSLSSHVASSMINKVVDIQGETEVDFEVPYLKPYPYLPLEEDIRGANGYLAVILLNPVAYPEFPIPPVEVNVWASGMEDLQFENLARSEHKQINFAIVLPEIQGQIVNEKQKEDESLSGSYVANVMDLAGKPSFRLTTQPNFQYDLTPFVPIRNGNGVTFQSLASIISTMFVGWAGDVGYTTPMVDKLSSVMAYSKIESRQIDQQENNSTIEEFVDRTSAIYPSYPLFQKNIVLPFYTNLKFIPTSLMYLADQETDFVKFPRITLQTGENGIVLCEYGAKGMVYGMPVGVPVTYRLS